MKYCLLLLFLLSFYLPLQVTANHLVGGEFRVSYQGNFTYSVQLHVYGDNATLGPGNEDNFVEVSTFDKQTNKLIETFQLGLGSSGFVAYNNPKCQSGSIQTKVLMYEAKKILAPSLYNNSAGYYLVWERCCRNNGIVNIQQPGKTGLVYYAELPPVIKNNQPFVNNMPVLPPMPPDFLCVGELYQYSMKATDPDGDKLVYSLSNPMAGHTSDDPNYVRTPGLPAPYKLVTWQNTIGVNNQIPGNPDLTIDPNTGLLQVRPTIPGLFVFAVTVSEYRNGLKIGEVRRDMQVKVNVCPINTSPKISLRAPGATRDYRPGDTLLVTDATNYCYPITFSDPDIGQNISVKAVPVNFSDNITITPSSGQVTQTGQAFSAQICWPDCSLNSPNSLFYADLIVKDDACSGAASDTLRLTFRVIPKKNDKPKIRVAGLVQNKATIQMGETISFNVVSTDSIDADGLQVSMDGLYFDARAAGMQLSPVSGKGKLVSVFSWKPTCDQLARSGMYRVKFTVRDNSCFMDHIDTDTVELFLKDVNDTTQFLPPNIFTPNKDGINDFFRTPTLPLDICNDAFQDIRIFNRWGVQVYRSTDRNFAWDGADISDGVYYYLIRFNKKKYKGWVEIVR